MLKRKLLLFLIFCSVFVYAENSPFVMISGGSSLTFDPHHSITMQEAQFYTACYEGLITFNPKTLEPMPGVADHWEISEDRTVYTFHLKRNARFDNGEQITAQIIRDTWLRLLNPRENAEYSVLLNPIQGAAEYRNGRLTNPDEIGILAEDNYTLRVKLDEPAAQFLYVLSHHSLVPIYPGNLRGRYWAPTRGIVGNGPYKITEQEEDTIYLEKNPYYWDAANVEIELLEVRLSSDRAANTTAFNYGIADWVTAGFNSDDLFSYNSVQVNAQFAASYFYFNVKQEEFANPLVRQGLAYIMNWHAIRSEERFSFPVEYLVPALPSYPERETISEQNLNRGLRLLKQAGYTNGSGLPQIVIKIGKSEVDFETATLIKESLEEHLTLDEEVLIQEYDWDNYYNELKEDDYTLGTITWIGDYGDPLTFLQLWDGDSNLNDSGYNNQEYNDLLADSMKLERSSRYEKLVEAENILLSTAVVLPINQPYAVNLIDTELIDGWYPNLLDIHPFKYLKRTIPEIPEGISMLQF